MPRLLIYDSEISGHHRDYLGAVYQALESRPDVVRDPSVVFMVPSAMQKLLGVSTLPASVSFRCLTDDELAGIKSVGKRKRSFLELDLIFKVAEEEGVDEIFLMNLDYFQVALASTAAKKTDREISGILFQPYTRFEKVATEHRFLLGEYFRAWRKRLRLTALLRNPSIKRLCIPCDQTAVNQLILRHGHKARFYMLPEPYFSGQIQSSTEAGSTIDIRGRFSIAPDARIVLVFGSIMARKNVPNLLRGLLSARLRYKGRIVLLIIGNATDAYRRELEQKIEQFRQAEALSVQTAARTETQVIFDCGFADEAIKDAAFSQSDIVAMPYFKAYQSSGIVFLAARFGKPVITANVGLMNELVNQYDLGETVDPMNVEEIAQAFDTLLNAPVSLDTSNAFFGQHTPEKHAACVLGIDQVQGLNCPD